MILPNNHRYWCIANRAFSVSCEVNPYGFHEIPLDDHFSTIGTVGVLLMDAGDVPDVSILHTQFLI
jgi:hypothetical protein